MGSNPAVLPRSGADDYHSDVPWRRVLACGVQATTSSYRERCHSVTGDLSRPVDLEGAGEFTSILFAPLAAWPMRRAPAMEFGQFLKRFAVGR